MKTFYRISDGSYPKDKLPGTSKRMCLNQFLAIFPDKPTIIADNCDETMSWLKNYSLEIIESKLGNAGALKLALELAREHDENELILFQEDDYLYKPRADRALIEADEDKIADYLTLYDHPDKYFDDYNFGEVSKVVMVNWQHWRYTISTTMTFACRVKTLIDDWDIWMKNLNDSHPPDHKIFTELNAKGKKLAVAIPGLACHTDLTYGFQKRKIATAPWAMETAMPYLIRFRDQKTCTS